MSRVSNVVVTVDEIQPAFVCAVNGWLGARGFGSLYAVATDGDCGGTKRMECEVYACAYNHFPDDEFIAFLDGVAVLLDFPENAVVVLTPQQSETIIWRPTYDA